MKTQMRFYRVHPSGRREIKVGVLYRQNKGRGKTRDHWDHAHFSLGCYDGWFFKNENNCNADYANLLCVHLR